jgi:hypothetical protein
MIAVISSELNPRASNLVLAEASFAARSDAAAAFLSESDM